MDNIATPVVCMLPLSTANMFLKRNRALSPHGFTAWIAAGSIFEGVENIDRWLPNVGYRLEVQPRMNLRVDFGFGRESTWVYFDFNEAF